MDYMKIDEGGWIIPPQIGFVEPVRFGEEEKLKPDMRIGFSLRDYFAGQALIGLIEKGFNNEHAPPMAYKYADAMIAQKRAAEKE